MRKKIEELRNREEGFTLVELLAVIVILGIIMAIAIPAIGKVINNAQSDANEAEEQLVEDAARMYFTTTENKKKTNVTVEVLKDEGYIDERDEDFSSRIPGDKEIKNPYLEKTEEKTEDGGEN